MFKQVLVYQELKFLFLLYSSMAVIIYCVMTSQMLQEVISQLFTMLNCSELLGSLGFSSPFSKLFVLSTLQVSSFSFYFFPSRCLRPFSDSQVGLLYICVFPELGCSVQVEAESRVSGCLDFYVHCKPTLQNKSVYLRDLC